MCRKCDEMIDGVVGRVVGTVPKIVGRVVAVLHESNMVPIAITAAGAFERIPEELLKKYFVLQMRCQNVVVQHGIGRLNPTSDMDFDAEELLKVSLEISEMCEEVVRNAAHTSSVHHSELN